MSTGAASPKVSTPPYVSFATFRAFVESLHTTIVPDHVDRSMMSNMSGASQSHLLTSMRFLGLLEGEDDRVTASLRQLVEVVGTDNWNDTLHAILKESYADIVSGLDLTSVTEKRLRDAFREVGHLDGTVLDRAVRFYVKALNDAGIKVSPHLGRRKSRTPRRTNGRARRSPAPVTQEQRGDADRGVPSLGTGVEGSTGMMSVPIPRPDKPSRVMYVPSDLDQDDCEMINQMLGAIAKRLQKNGSQG